MKTLTREGTIEALRNVLVAVAGDHSICKAAKEKNLFCHGFDQWKLYELKARYPQITRSRSRLSREAMEELADRWQLARQMASGEVLSCDVQLREGDRRTCAGWDEFDDEELERFHRELCGEEIRIQKTA